MVDPWGSSGPAATDRSTARPASRRTVRDGRGTDARRGRPQAQQQAAPARTTPAPVRPRRRATSRVVFSALVMTFAAALVATIALPSYAFDPARTGSLHEVSGRSVAAGGQQQFAASGDVKTAAIGRDGFTATTSAELRRRAYAQQYSAYTGPTASDYIKNPAHPPFSLSAVYQTALQYQGVPYVFGGADPSGFDCSGFVMFVYAQYGVSLPHSVHEQDGLAMQISPADAQPGDVVVFNDDSHDGFYAGNGMILHAPYPGARVRVQPLWSSDIHFVRFGAN